MTGHASRVMAAIAAMLTLLAVPVAGATASDEARAALAQLDAAAAQLKAAGDARDQVAALTQTVQAFEQGLAAVRSGLRGAVLQEEALTQRLGSKEAEVASLLGLLQTVGRAPEQQLLLHPDGALGSARSGMILTEMTPVLQAQVEDLRLDLAEVVALRQLQQDAAAGLRAGLVDIQEARATLAQAIADRTPLPKRFSADPVGMAVLLAASETLEAFATGLGDLPAAEDAPPLPTARRLLGTLRLPVQGTVLRAFGESDAAGVERPGVIYAARPLSLVTAPAAATVRYQGPLLDYGNVMILEPAQELLVVLAGISEVYVQIGDVVQTGSPLGLMGPGDGRGGDRGDGVNEGGGDAASATENSSGPGRSETLYIEVRQSGAAQDPTLWFETARE